MTDALSAILFSCLVSLFSSVWCVCLIMAERTPSLFSYFIIQQIRLQVVCKRVVRLNSHALFGIIYVQDVRNHF